MRRTELSEPWVCLKDQCQDNAQVSACRLALSAGCRRARVARRMGKYTGLRAWPRGSGLIALQSIQNEALSKWEPALAAYPRAVPPPPSSRRCGTRAVSATARSTDPETLRILTRAREIDHLYEARRKRRARRTIACAITKRRWAGRIPPPLGASHSHYSVSVGGCRTSQGTVRMRAGAALAAGRPGTGARQPTRLGGFGRVLAVRRVARTPRVRSVGDRGVRSLAGMPACVAGPTALGCVLGARRRPASTHLPQVRNPCPSTPSVIAMGTRCGLPMAGLRVRTRRPAPPGWMRRGPPVPPATRTRPCTR